MMRYLLAVLFLMICACATPDEPMSPTGVWNTQSVINEATCPGVLNFAIERVFTVEPNTDNRAEAAEFMITDNSDPEAVITGGMVLCDEVHCYLNVEETFYGCAAGWSLNSDESGAVTGSFASTCSDADTGDDCTMSASLTTGSLL